MPVQHSHDRPYPMAPRADELPEGVQAAVQAEARDERTAEGRWTPGARTAQVKGGRSRKGRTALTQIEGVARYLSLPEFAPYLRAAKVFAKTQCGVLAETVGGGLCGPAPCSVVTSASLQMAAGQFVLAKAAETGDPALFLSGSKLLDASRNNLLSAAELCANEAKRRPRPDNAIDIIRREVNGPRTKTL